MASAELYGWDLGGAHVKVCRMEQGRLREVAQWPCALWQGLDRLDAVLKQVGARWPDITRGQLMVTHAVTMSGEMVDLFANRQQGVAQLSAHLAQALAPATVRLFAGDAGWCAPADAPRHWASIASANWLATARHVAQALAPAAGILVDIGSTTTDFIAFADGRVSSHSRSDADRLGTGELVYHGVVRTPLCALAPRVPWHGRPMNVMHEWFATTADVYRLTGELDPRHDLQPTADQASKDLRSTQQRLARMIGLDAHDGSPDDWLALAQAWRGCQVSELAGQLQRVLAAHGLGAEALVVVAGCGAFLLPALMARTGLQHRRAYASLVLGDGDNSDNSDSSDSSDNSEVIARAGWAQVCAPCIAVAALLARESG